MRLHTRHAQRPAMAVPDHTLRQAALYADAVPQMALVKRRGMLPAQVLLQRYLERHLGTVEELRQVLPGEAGGSCWSSSRELLRDLAEVWDDMQYPHHRRRRPSRIQFRHQGIFRGRTHERLHIMYRLPMLTTRIWRRRHLSVLALIF